MLLPPKKQSLSRFAPAPFAQGSPSGERVIPLQIGADLSLKFYLFACGKPRLFFGSTKALPYGCRVCEANISSPKGLYRAQSAYRSPKANIDIPLRVHKHIYAVRGSVGISFAKRISRLRSNHFKTRSVISSQGLPCHPALRNPPTPAGISRLRSKHIETERCEVISRS